MNLPNYSFQYLPSNIGNELIKCSILYFEFFEDLKKLILKNINDIFKKEESSNINNRDELAFKTLRNYYLLSDKFYQIVNIDENTEKIMDNLFHDADIQKIIIPQNVKEIGEKAFHQCKKLETIIIKSIIMEKIGISAFSGCEKLTFIALPDSIKMIDESTFENCKGLKKVKFPNELQEIKENAFSGCRSLTIIELPKTIKNIGYASFNKCTNLQTFKIPGVISIYSNEEIQNEMEESLNDDVLIESKCFYKCKELRNVIIKRKYQYIKDFTFANCSNLETITLHVSSNTINGKRAFFECIRLNKITIIVCEGSKLTLEDSCFQNCKELKEIIFENINLFGEGSFIMKNNVFCGCEKLEKFNFPSGCEKNIGENCFENCTSLKSVTLPQGITKISKFMFKNCVNLETINLHDSIESIEDSAFENDAKLILDEFPLSLKTIGMNSFKDCRSIKLKRFPDNISEIGSEAFMNCESLVEITFPKSIKLIGQKAFEKCNNLETITNYSMDYQVLRKAFSNCQKLKKIFYNSKNGIHSEAFKNCSRELDYYKIEE